VTHSTDLLPSTPSAGFSQLGEKGGWPTPIFLTHESAPFLAFVLAKGGLNAADEDGTPQGDSIAVQNQS